MGAQGVAFGILIMVRRSRYSNKGFTLVELLIAVVIAGVLAGIGYPRFAELRRSFVRNGMKQQLDSDVHRVRSEAVRAGARALLVADADGDGYSIGLDYPPYGSPAAIDAGATMVTRKLPKGFALELPHPLIFDSRGYCVDAGGAPDNAVYSVSDGAETYLNATVYPTGYIRYGS